ncbi:hypothetical protein [Chitinophaga sp. XS-30]|nr:hypothetical protein [Chitinophaga sp. XS-30]
MINMKFWDGLSKGHPGSKQSAAVYQGGVTVVDVRVLAISAAKV